jgi:glyoxylase-like metal-dependent hydrolase (beta-lactamase superfamily II)
MKNIGAALALVIGSIALLGAISVEAQQTPTRSITQIGEDLFRAQNNLHYAVFLVTDEGIILVDPINADFSAWLKNELAARFDVPVRYVLYSHHHQDHSSGGGVFKDTAQFVGHENMLHGLSSASLTDEVVTPNLTYKDRMTITLGGKDVELIYTGIQTHTDDMSIVRFPDAGAIFVVDFISIRQVPGWPVGSGMLDAWLNAIRLTEALDYELAAGAHGAVGTKADVTAVRHYLEELRSQVAEGIAAGVALEEMQDTIRMEPYQSWMRYEELRQRNVEGMYLMLTEARRLER